MELVAAGNEPVAASDLAEARRYLRHAGEAALQAFAERQLAARRRLTELIAFYRRHPCRMANVHLLGGAVVALGRFAGLSPAYARMGEALHPLDADGRPKNDAWRAYLDACERRKPREIRDEAWIAAHVQDLADLRRRKLEEAFFAEAAAHADDPDWEQLRIHMEFTLGTRRLDEAAVSGQIPLETAISGAMSRAIARLLRVGWLQAWAQAKDGARAVLLPSREAPRAVVSYRRTAFEVLLRFFAAFAAGAVYRRGLRVRDRGHLSDDHNWSFLEDTLGDRLREVEAEIVRFYRNPALYDVTCSLELYSNPARFWSRALTLLVGQGLYEASTQTWEARIRTFRRPNGAMHFVREIYCEGILRVFDSDFVIRRQARGPTLYEEFPVEKIDVELIVASIGDGGVSIRSDRIFWRGLRIPRLALIVEFRSAVEREGREIPAVRLDGTLTMKPRTRFGRWLMHRVLGQPELLGRIRYVATPRAGSVDTRVERQGVA